MSDLVEQLVAVVGAPHVSSGADVSEDYSHDEALTAEPVRPDIVVRPATTAEVAAVLRLADDARVPVTARWSRQDGRGLQRSALPVTRRITAGDTAAGTGGRPRRSVRDRPCRSRIRSAACPAATRRGPRRARWRRRQAV